MFSQQELRSLVTRRDHKPASSIGDASPSAMLSLHDDPEARGHAVEAHEFEARKKFWQPPCRGVLNQVRVTPVRQNSFCGSGVHRKNSHARRHPLQIVQHILEQIRLDMLEHVDTRNKTAWRRRRRPLGNRGIVVVNFQFLLKMLSKGYSRPLPAP